MELEQKIRKERGEPPIVPGFIWCFQSYRNDLLTLKNSSTAKISGLPSPFLEYATLYKGGDLSFFFVRDRHDKKFAASYYLMDI